MVVLFLPLTFKAATAVKLTSLPAGSIRQEPPALHVTSQCPLVSLPDQKTRDEENQHYQYPQRQYVVWRFLRSSPVLFYPALTTLTIRQVQWEVALSAEQVVRRGSVEIWVTARGFPVRHLERPIVRQRKEMLQPLYLGVGLFGVHAVPMLQCSLRRSLLSKQAVLETTLLLVASILRDGRTTRPTTIRKFKPPPVPAA